MAVPCRRTRLVRTLRVCGLTLAAVLAGPLLGAAHADGDPADDVLVASPPVFLSADSGASYAQETALAAQLRSAAARGHPLRLAVISHRVDLGSVSVLWGRPQTYAVFLGRELSLNYRGELLVVMPSGFGVVRNGVATRTSLAGLAPRRGQLIRASEQAVARLTGVAAGAAPATVAAAPSRAAGIGWWSTVGIAVAVVATGWAASLRRRPLARLRLRAGRHA